MVHVLKMSFPETRERERRSSRAPLACVSPGGPAAMRTAMRATAARVHRPFVLPILSARTPILSGLRAPPRAAPRATYSKMETCV